MAKKKTTLPEHIVKGENEVLSKQAKNALDEREQVNYHTGEEKEWKQKIAVNSSALREILIDDDEIIGKITIAPPDQTAVRVEFRINNGSMDTDEMDNLDKLFEGARSELFEKAEVVESITDPTALIEALTNEGLDPWDYLNINVKKNMDKIIIDKGTGINTADAILPRQGFMAKLPDLWKRFSEEAKLYIKNYLKLALEPVVVLGTKAKK
jgi:hypothetical protein